MSEHHSSPLQSSQSKRGAAFTRSLLRGCTPNVARLIINIYIYTTLQVIKVLEDKRKKEQELGEVRTHRRQIFKPWQCEERHYLQVVLDYHHLYQDHDLLSLDSGRCCDLGIYSGSHTSLV